MNEIPPRVCIGKRYGPAMTIQSQAEADEFFEGLVSYAMRAYGVSREEAEEVERTNLGYYAGYYDAETRGRVERLFKCEHPFFGAIAERGQPTPEEAFEMGKKWARGVLRRSQDADARG